MIQAVPKWKVTVILRAETRVFWIFDHHLSNVLHKVSEMQFTENGLEQPISITVESVA